ncbi:MAG: hypothetical protein WBA76_07035, partial [Phormidesmis sp.]
MAFFFPDAHRDIDWTRGHEFLDTELQRITREAETGKRIADKLVKVWTKAGEQVWVLVHIEVQSQREADFAKRMYTYNYRLQDLYNRPVTSFAILSDDSPSWRPHNFSFALWGTTVDFEFRTVKLLDYQQQWDELLASENPFSVAVMAHLKTLETSGDQTSRKRWKLSLIKLLYQRGYGSQDVIKLLRFIDWLLALPLELEDDLWQNILTYQEEMKMPYLTGLERISINKGLQQGLEQGLQQGLAEGLKRGIKIVLKLKFGNPGLELFSELEGITDVATLEQIEAGLDGELTLDEIRQLYSQPAD